MKIMVKFIIQSTLGAEELTLEQPHSQVDCFSKFETQYREHHPSSFIFYYFYLLHNINAHSKPDITMLKEKKVTAILSRKAEQFSVQKSLKNNII